MKTLYTFGMTVKYMEGGVFAYNVKFAQKLHSWNDIITPRNNLACCKQTQNKDRVCMEFLVKVT